MIKKTLFKFLLILTVIFSIGVTNIFADSTGVVTASKLNVRKGPSTKYSTMGSLYKNKGVTILGESNGWYKIEYNGKYGYVSGSYIELDSTEPDQDNKINFTDVSQDYWAYSQIQDFVKKGYIEGYGDNTFRPKEPIKRNEFVKHIRGTDDGQV